MSRRRPPGIAIVAVLMIVFGLVEIATGFRHRFFGVSTSQATMATFAGAAIGALYAVAGLLILSMKKWAAGLAIVLLIADIGGRIAMVATALYPVNSFMQTLAIILGTSIVAAFAIYVGFKWSSFR